MGIKKFKHFDLLYRNNFFFKNLSLLALYRKVFPNLYNKISVFAIIVR